jgi:hypothetical protein
LAPQAGHWEGEAVTVITGKGEIDPKPEEIVRRVRQAGRIAPGRCEGKVTAGGKLDH